MSGSKDGCGGDVCGDEDCPCYTCLGDPKRHLGGTHSGIDLKDDDGFPTGEVECPTCGAVTGP